MNVSEFQNIMPIQNIPLVLKLGILSHEMASRLPHQSVALSPVQDRREQVDIPSGLKLHQYANVYFHARNPMMSKLRDQACDLCVLRVNPTILDISGVVLADQNAASRYVRFLPANSISQLRLDYIYERNWKHPDNQFEEWKHSSAKCAEALVPQKIAPQYLMGAYVANPVAEQKLYDMGFGLPITIDSDLFFQ